MIHFITSERYPLRLPLWRRVVFVDWHGVLSSDVFWFSILQNCRHPYRQRLSQATETLFTRHADLVDAWMRGSLTDEEIVTSLHLRLDRRSNADFLLRRLRDDCRRMRAHPQLLAELCAARRDSFVVLATDNMDCFAHRLRAGRDLERSIDAVLCSATLGVLKTDSVLEFFGPWLAANNLTFAQSVLLDDSPRICDAFRDAGGTAVLVTTPEHAVLELRRWRLQ